MSSKRTKFDAGVKAAARTEQIECSLSVITLASSVNVCLGKHNQGCSLSIPLHLDLVAFEEALLRHRRTKLRYKEYLDSSGLTL